MLHNAPSKLQKVPLTGVGVLAAVTLTPTALTFARQVVYTTSKAQIVTLTDSGLGVLNISKMTVIGQFSQTNNCGPTVSPGGSCTFTVTFKPTTPGALTGSLSVADNAPGSPQAVTLKGTGTDLQLAPLGLAFGNQPVGTSSLAKTIALSNKGHVSKWEAQSSPVYSGLESPSFKFAK